MPQILTAPSTSPPGSQVTFRDGTSTTVAADTTISCPNNFVTDMLNAGFTVGALSSNLATIGVPELLFRFELAAGALADTDIIVAQKIRVIDAWLILRGAGVSTTTLQVKNGANAISTAMAASGSDQALIRATTLDDANWEISAGGTLRVTSATGASQPAAIVFVKAIRVP